MSLLIEELPLFSLRPQLAPPDFFDRCEIIAKEKHYGIDRRSEYIGPDSDLLNVYVGGKPNSSPMIRMVWSARLRDRVKVDVVDGSVELVYDDYVPHAKNTCNQFLRDYAERFGVRLRLGVPKRRPHFDPAFLKPVPIPYARSKFESAIREMAIGQGDIRERLENAFLTVSVIEPKNMPEPLQSVLSSIHADLTKRPARWDGEGRLAATFAVLRRKKCAEIARQILEIYDALVEIEEKYCHSI